MQQQMQTFPTAEVYQARCAGIGNVGIGTGKHYKVHLGNGTFGVGNFNNYVHGMDPPDARGMTRIVFNGNSNRNDFHCGTDFQNCVGGSEIIDNTGNYQFFVNPNGGNMRYVRQQMNPSFHGDNMQRCYLQRPQPQGQQARFVRVQGSKMRPNVTYRNFNNNHNQQRQKQNRRFNQKGFNNNNNYKSQKNVGADLNANGGFFGDEEIGSSPKGTMQQQQGFLDVTEKEVVRKTPTNHSKQESQQSKSTKTIHGINPATFDPYSYNNRSNKGCSPSGGGALLEPKVEYVSNSLHNLSYDDISENSDDNNDDSDLRERLTRKKQDQIIKREPGELDSDEDEVEAPVEKEVSNKRKSKKKSDDNSKASSAAGSSSEVKSKEHHKKLQKSGRSDPERNYGHGLSNQDSRGSPYVDNKGSAKRHKSHCPSPKIFGSSTYVNGANQNYCCSEVEVTELKDKISTLKQSLREAQDKLLETSVIGSKKALRMQEEITQLKKQLEDAAKNENELKTKLRNADKELSAKNAELTKMSMMNEVEKQDKVKFTSEMSRTYKERLTIEVEKLRALFDVEVAKMQAFYMTPNMYEEDTNIPFADISSGGDLQNQNAHTHQNEMVGGNSGNNACTAATRNINGHDTRDVINNSHQHRDLPFMQTYFNSPPPQTSVSMMGTTPFSLLENVMAYNSLIHHQQIYAQTTASTGSTNCTETTGTNMGTHCGM